MFLVKDSSQQREQRIQAFSQEDPSLSALLAVIHFEWTVRRAIIALGTSPNVDVREKLTYCHGCDKYKDVWKEEVFPRVDKRLPEVVRNWDGLLRAFRLRHRLVHGVNSCSTAFATDRVLWAIDACHDIREVSLNHGVDLDKRLPVRRRPRK
jgi:hypothetical protein